MNQLPKPLDENSPISTREEAFKLGFVDMARYMFENRQVINSLIRYLEERENEGPTPSWDELSDRARNKPSQEPPKGMTSCEDGFHTPKCDHFQPQKEKECTCPRGLVAWSESIVIQCPVHNPIPEQEKECCTCDPNSHGWACDCPCHSKPDLDVEGNRKPEVIMFNNEPWLHVNPEDKKINILRDGKHFTFTLPD